MMDRRQRWREKNPYRYKYQSLKHSAKRRDIPFNLSFAGFLAIDKIDWYVFYSGPRQSADSPTVDRILPLSKEPRGYVDGNCQILTNAENRRKAWREYDPKPLDLRLENNDIACPF